MKLEEKTKEELIQLLEEALHIIDMFENSFSYQRQAKEFFKKVEYGEYEIKK